MFWQHPLKTSRLMIECSAYTYVLLILDEHLQSGGQLRKHLIASTKHQSFSLSFFICVILQLSER